MKTNKENFLVLLMCTIWGYLVYKQIYWAAICLQITTGFCFLYWTKSGCTNAKKSILLFLSSFLAYCSAMLPFLPAAIREFSGAPLSFAFLFSLIIICVNSIPYFIPQLSLHFVHRPSWIFFPICLISSLFVILIPNFGNLTIGDAIAQYIFFQPLVRTIGVPILTGLMTFCIIGSFYFFVRKKYKSWFAFLSIVFVFSVIAQRLDQRLNPSLPISKVVQLALVQSNFNPNALQFLNGESNFIIFTENLIEKIGNHSFNQKPDLLVFPESGFPAQPIFPWIEADRKRRSEGNSKAVSDFFDTSNFNILIEKSLATFDESGSHQIGFSPTAVFISKDSALPVDFVRKEFLVPFLEYTPLQDTYPIFTGLFPWAVSRTSNDPRNLVDVSGIKARTLICYDSLFAEPYISGLSSGAEIFIAMTNNLYLGRGSHYQHAITVSRVIEYGKPLFFVGNYGDSGIISSTVITKSKLGEQQIISASTDGLFAFNTFYAQNISPLLQRYFVKAFFIIGILIFSFWFFWHLQATGIRMWVKSIVRIAPYAVVVIATIIGYNYFVGQVAQVVLVPSVSMEPTIQRNSKILVCRRHVDLKRGKVVSARFGLDSISNIKRIILLPGEKMERGGIISSYDKNKNPVKLEVKYSKDALGKCFESIGDESWEIFCSNEGSLLNLTTDSLLENEIFIIGDNRTKSEDSREYGPIRITNVDGELCQK